MIKSFEYFVVIWFCYFDIYLDTLKILRTHPLRQTKKRKIKTKKKRERGRGREEIIGCTPLSLILLVYLLFTFLNSSWFVVGFDYCRIVFASHIQTYSFYFGFI